jgi:dTDP-4-amino-4,6-dideoxygalactose transaminase
MPVPLVDVKAQYAPLLRVLRRRIDEVLDGGVFILGPNVQAFEEEAAAFLGARGTVGVANGTDAIALVLEAVGIGRGDEVVCPAFTFYATVEPVLRLGATPVFADIDPSTLNLDAADVAAKTTDRTKAILAVHLFGRPAPLGELPEGVPVIEDCAQAFGARLGGRRVGSIGLASTFSFFPTKNLFALGDGGLVASSDDDLLDTVRMLRFHGSRDKQRFELVGYNSRLDELQAAALRVFLPEVERWNQLRREAAARYAELGLGELVELPEDEPGHVYHVYSVRTSERDSLVAGLRAAGVGCAAYYSTPLHLQPALAGLGWKRGSLPETERASAEILALPIWAGIDARTQERVVEAVTSAVPIRAS